MRYSSDPGTEDGSLHHIWQRPEGGWSAWNSLGGPVIGTPSIAGNANGLLELFAHWADGRLAHRWQNPDGGWSDWEFIDAILSDDPEVVRVATGSLAVFARNADGQVIYRLQGADGAWSDWLLLTQGFADTVTAVRTGGGFLDVFTSQPDQPLLWVRLTGAGEWITSEFIGARTVTKPVAGVSGAEAPLVFAIDSLGDIVWTQLGADGVWREWQTLPDLSTAERVAPAAEAGATACPHATPTAEATPQPGAGGDSC